MSKTGLANKSLLVIDKLWKVAFGIDRFPGKHLKVQGFELTIVTNLLI